MRSAIVMLQLAVMAQAHTKDLVAKDVPNAQNSMEQLVDKLVNELFDRALDAWPIHSTDLENTTMGKGPAHLAQPRAPAANLSPRYRGPSGIPESQIVHGDRSTSMSSLWVPRIDHSLIRAGSSIPELNSRRGSRPGRDISAQATAKDKEPMKTILPKQAAELMQEGWIMLDVRPPGECAKASVQGTVNVPIYIEDPSLGPGGLINKAITGIAGGLWMGAVPMIGNKQFLPEVLNKVDKDSPGVIVACQKGLRSLEAIEALDRAGYPRLAWIKDGFQRAKPGELPTVDGVDIRNAAKGGISGALGLNPVDQVQKWEKEQEALAAEKDKTS